MSDIYDIANWRPITPAKYTEELCAAALVAGEPETLPTQVESLSDGRIRLVTLCEVKVSTDQSADEPYLMMIHDPEGGSVVCFRRWNRELALA